MKHLLLALLVGLFMQPIFSQTVVQLDQLPNLPGGFTNDAYIPVKKGGHGYKATLDSFPNLYLQNNFFGDNIFQGNIFGHGDYFELSNQVYYSGIMRADLYGNVTIGDYNANQHHTSIAVLDQDYDTYGSIYEYSGHYDTRVDHDYIISTNSYPNGVFNIAQNGDVTIGDPNSFYTTFRSSTNQLSFYEAISIPGGNALTMTNEIGGYTNYLDDYGGHFNHITTLADGYGSSTLNLGNLLTGGSYSGEYGGGTPSAGLVIEVNGTPFVVPLLAY